MNANLKAATDCFIDKSLLKCLVVNDNINNVLMTSLIYVTLLVVAIIFITSVFRSYCLAGATEIIEKLNEFRECNKEIIWPRCASRSYWHHNLEAYLSHIITCM